MITGAPDDVSWETLRRITREWAGESAELDEVVPLAGGHINSTLKLKTRAGEQAVLKISAHRINRDYPIESMQLEQLRSIGIPVPTVYGLHSGSLEAPFSYLIMQWVEGCNLHEAKHKAPAEQYDRLQVQLADMVALLHSQTGPDYRRVIPDNGQAYATWGEFFRTVYDAIWHEVEKSDLLHVKVRKKIAKIHQRLDHLIAHADQPRLTHWDLWSGNVLAHPDTSGNWQITAILDPNCKFAHAEAEIAYLDLFHTVNHAFTRNYTHQHKLPPEYHQYRKLIYQLYFMLDHVNLFGREYVKPVEELTDKLHAVV